MDRYKGSRLVQEVLRSIVITLCLEIIVISIVDTSRRSWTLDSIVIVNGDFFLPKLPSGTQVTTQEGE